MESYSSQAQHEQYSAPDESKCTNGRVAVVVVVVVPAIER